jgi:hypothetical protein
MIPMAVMPMFTVPVVIHPGDQGSRRRGMNTCDRWGGGGAESGKGRQATNGGGGEKHSAHRKKPPFSSQAEMATEFDDTKTGSGLSRGHRQVRIAGREI